MHFVDCESERHSPGIAGIATVDCVIEMRITASALKRRFAELRDLVNEWDPIGLIDTGAPKDEYECLVGPILRRLEAHNSVHDIAAFLDHEMVDHFGVSGVTGSLAFAVKVEAWYIGRWPDTENVPLPDPDPDKRRRD